MVTFPLINPLNPYCFIICFMQSFEFLNFCYPLDCIMTLINSAGLVTKDTMNPATAPFYNPSIKVKVYFPLSNLYSSYEVKRIELINGKVISGQQRPLKSCEYPQCLMMYLRAYVMEVSQEFICILTLTVSKKNPERQLVTPDNIPLEKSIRLFIILIFIIMYKNNKQHLLTVSINKALHKGNNLHPKEKELLLLFEHY